MDKKQDNKQQIETGVVSKNSGSVANPTTSDSPISKVSGLKYKAETCSYRFDEIEEIPKDESVKRILL